MISLFFIFREETLLFLRLGFGLIFIFHGLPKLNDLKKTANNFSAMGFKPGIFWGTLAAVAEVLGGFLILFGLLTQAAGLALAILMLVAAIWRIIKRHPFVNGWDLDLALFLIGLGLAALGGGAYSLDKYFNFWLV